jgi:propionate catabolism operon transcriptional regulator
MARKAMELELEMTVPELCRPQPALAPRGAATSVLALQDVSLASQAAHIRQVLQLCQGDRKAACQLLGISAATLWRRLKQA